MRNQAALLGLVTPSSLPPSLNHSRLEKTNRASSQSRITDPTELSKASKRIRREKEADMPTLTKLYSMQEAAEHGNKDDCWVVIDGKVYDVSSYLDEHPGGDDVVLAVTGKDATDDFEDAGHSEEARELMEKFCIGELDESAPAIPELEISSRKQQADYAEKLKDLPKQYWVVPVAVMGISVVVGLLYLRKK